MIRHIRALKAVFLPPETSFIFGVGSVIDLAGSSATELSFARSRVDFGRDSDAAALHADSLAALDFLRDDIPPDLATAIECRRSGIRGKSKAKEPQPFIPKESAMRG